MYEITSPNILTTVGIMVPPFLVGVGAIVGGNYLCTRNGLFPLLIGFLIQVGGGFITFVTGWCIIMLLTVAATERPNGGDGSGALMLMFTLLVALGMLWMLKTLAEKLFKTDSRD